MERPTREQRKLLQGLSEKAHELELSSLLKNLSTKFDQWKSGDITPWELSDAINEFHENDAQDLYRFYTLGQQYGYQVAHAIQGGHLTMEDVPESCRERVQYFLDNLSDF